MARVIDGLKGVEKIWDRLRNQKFQGKLPHAMAFSGAGAVEKMDFAWAFAQLLVCEKEESPCGSCGPCLRVEGRSSESVLLIAPEKNTIKLEAAHDILNFLSLQRVSRARIVIIDQAHLLNLQTANALLKAVEEPPPETYFVLVTSEFSLLLPTLRSRVQTVRFAPGDYVDDPEQKELRDLAARFLEQAGRGQRAALEEAQAESKDREVALQFVRLLQRELRGQTLAQASTDPENLRRRTDLWQSAYKVELDVLANVDRSLLLENFFYRARAALS